MTNPTFDREARLELIREQLEVTTTWQRRLNEELKRLQTPPYVFAAKLVVDAVPETLAADLIAYLETAVDAWRAKQAATLPRFDLVVEESELVICTSCHDAILHWQFENHTCERNNN